MSWLRHRAVLPTLMVGWAALMLPAVAFSQSVVTLPLTIQPVPVSMLVTCSAGLLVLIPLGGSFDQVETTFIRLRTDRALSAIIGLSSSLSVVIVALRQVTTTVPVELALWLLAGAICAQTLLRELAWLPSLALALAALATDYALPDTPVSALTREVGVLPPLASLLAAVTWFVLHDSTRPSGKRLSQTAVADRA